MLSQSPLRLILASQSPRRRELASAAGWDVIVTPPPEQVEASADPQRPGETITDFVARLAHAKAAAVASSLLPTDPASRDRIILACDTLGEIDGIALGKPRGQAVGQRYVDQGACAGTDSGAQMQRLLRWRQYAAI